MRRSSDFYCHSGYYYSVVGIVTTLRCGNREIHRRTGRVATANTGRTKRVPHLVLQAAFTSRNIAGRKHTAGELTFICGGGSCGLMGLWPHRAYVNMLCLVVLLYFDLDREYRS
jgi:hypothetical protein